MRYGLNDGNENNPRYQVLQQRWPGRATQDKAEGYWSITRRKKTKAGGATKPYPDAWDSRRNGSPVLATVTLQYLVFEDPIWSGSMEITLENRSFGIVPPGPEKLTGLLERAFGIAPHEIVSFSLPHISNPTGMLTVPVKLKFMEFLPFGNDS